MKLLAVSTSAWNKNNREFYRRISNKNLEVKLIVPKFWNFGKGIVDAKISNEKQINLQFLKPTNFHQRLFYLRGIFKLINKYKPNVIFYEGDPASLMCLVLGLLAIINKAKFTAISCENLMQTPIATMKREGIKSIFSSFVKFTLIIMTKPMINDLLVINNGGYNCFKKLNFKSVIKTPLGFNESTFYINEKTRKNIRLKNSISDSTFVISYFGRVVHEKGVHLIVEALKNLNFKNWIFLIDDFSGYRNDYFDKIYKSLKTYNILDKTIFFRANHTEIADYMNAADISILASIKTKKWIEQYGRVVPEAMACGNRVLISNKGAQTQFFPNDYPFKFSEVSELKDLIEVSYQDFKNDNIDKYKISDYSIKNFSISNQVDIYNNILSKY